MKVKKFEKNSWSFLYEIFSVTFIVERTLYIIGTYSIL